MHLHNWIHPLTFEVDLPLISTLLLPASHSGKGFDKAWAQKRVPHDS